LHGGGNLNLLKEYDTEIGHKIPLGEWGQWENPGLLTEKMQQIAAWRGE
jgi:hypothetical protein